ncbi:MAG TPA: hemerythrin family protein [Selenomonadales bacterium]|nr:hemerythrin family protein [Selenomonadales bacterium]
MIRWKEEYRLGVDLIDEQHKRLLELANQMQELLRNDLVTDKYDQIVQMLNELKDYTVYHFKCEEEYMESIGYKRLLSQKVDHNDFIEKMNAIDLDRIDDNQNEYLLGMLSFVVDWIDFHILKKDKLIVADPK